jgi:hypothetical protein
MKFDGIVVSLSLKEITDLKCLAGDEGFEPPMQVPET